MTLIHPKRAQIRLNDPVWAQKGLNKTKWPWMSSKESEWTQMSLNKLKGAWKSLNKDTVFFYCTKIVFFTTSYCLLHCQWILWYKYTLSYMYIEEQLKILIEVVRFQYLVSSESYEQLKPE